MQKNVDCEHLFGNPNDVRAQQCELCGRWILSTDLAKYRAGAVEGLLVVPDAKAQELFNGMRRIAREALQEKRKTIPWFGKKKEEGNA